MTPPSIDSASGSCPHLGTQFQPFNTECQGDPYSFYARARSEEPGCCSEHIDALIVARYEEVASVMRDPKTFSAGSVVDFVKPPCKGAMAPLMDPGFVPGSVLVNEDNPERHIHCDLLGRAFTKERLAALEPEAIDEIVRRIPQIQLVGDQVSEFSHNIIFRDPKAVLTEWDPTQNPQPADRP